MKSVRGIGSLVLFACTLAPPAPAQTKAAAAPGELPLELAFSAKTIRRWEKPAVSANGQVLAFDVYTPPTRSATSELAEGIRFTPGGTPEACVGLRVHYVPTAGGVEKDICPEKGNCWRPSPSPDGKWIAFYSDADGPPQLWVYDVAAGKPRRVAEPAIKAKHWPGDEAVWSPDGKEVFVPLRPKGQTFDKPATPKATLPPAGAKLEKPTVLVYATSGGAAAPVGAAATPSAMLEHFIRENNAELAAIEIASGKVRTVVPAEAEPRPSSLRLSPDGKWVSYLSVFKQKGETTSETYYDLAVVPAAGGKPALVAADLQVPENDYFGASYRWIPGSTRLAVWKDRKLWLMDAAAPSAAPKQLAAALGALEEEPFLLTADGRALLVGQQIEGEKTYYSVEPRAIALVPLDGTAPKIYDFTGTPVSADGGTRLWQPDAKRFAVVRNDAASGERSVVSVDAASGATTTLWKGRGRFEAAGAGTGGTIVARFESFDTPPNFYSFPPTLASKTRLSHVEPRLDSVVVGPMTTFTSAVPGYDGRLQNVQSALFFPPSRKDGERVPTIVYFYSGSQTGATAQSYGGGAPNSIPVQVFASRGYGVLLVDVPLGPQGKGGNPIQEMGDAILGQVYRSAGLGYTDVERVRDHGTVLRRLLRRPR